MERVDDRLACGLLELVGRALEVVGDVVDPHPPGIGLRQVPVDVGLDARHLALQLLDRRHPQEEGLRGVEVAERRLHRVAVHQTQGLLPPRTAIRQRCPLGGGEKVVDRRAQLCDRGGRSHLGADELCLRIDFERLAVHLVAPRDSQRARRSFARSTVGSGTGMIGMFGERRRGCDSPTRARVATRD